jgi:hypothetical protein
VTDDGTPGDARPDPTLRELLGSEEFRLDVIRQIGGWRGIAESAIPTVAFIAVNVMFGLWPAIWASVGIAVLIAVLRLARHQSPRQALNGLFGIAIAAWFAGRSGKTADFYLPGIIYGFVYAAAIAGSIVMRRPLVGVVWAFFTGARDWRADRRVYRIFMWLTLMWAAVSAAKVGVGLALYLAEASATVQGIVRLVLGYPVFLSMTALTVWITARIAKDDVHPDPALEGPVLEGSG